VSWGRVDPAITGDAQMTMVPGGARPAHVSTCPASGGTVGPHVSYAAGVRTDVASLPDQDDALAEAEASVDAGTKVIRPARRDDQHGTMSRYWMHSDQDCSLH
jgi:hypothetical protein